VAGGRARDRAAREPDRQIRAHGRNVLSRANFTFDTERDLYVCPGGKELRKSRRAFSTPREGVATDGTIRYRAAQHDCDACMLKPKCCPNMLARKIARSVHEAARDKARAIAKTEAYAVSRDRSALPLIVRHLDNKLHPMPPLFGWRTRAGGRSKVPVVVIAGDCVALRMMEQRETPSHKGGAQNYNNRNYQINCHHNPQS
jgi:hypothetical protein